MSTEYEDYQLIWQTVAKIPYGKVATYGQIAELAGLPKQARLVGYALHNTPTNSDMDIPWHRVINAKGMISFPVNSEAYQRQLDRLVEEGIELINGRIDFAVYRWQSDSGGLDELLWKPSDEN